MIRYFTFTLLIFLKQSLDFDMPPVYLTGGISFFW